ncbi:putative lyase [Gimesia chilikensis]|uniref:Putative lyase n=2 Tax=Gimesia chilikensis TaxID=2605989 RepID=A0A517W523_9PLAN|nr:putative lyase [Gimesia chilikensis]
MITGVHNERKCLNCSLVQKMREEQSIAAEPVLALSCLCEEQVICPAVFSISLTKRNRPANQNRKPMKSSHQEQIDRILEKLSQVRAQGLSCFGSDQHHFELNPPIQERLLLEFENEYRVRLPDEFRAFLLYAGNGGAGPYYGIAPLPIIRSKILDWPFEEPFEKVLDLPCPLYFRMKQASDWESEFGKTDPYQGTMYIGTQGCSYYMLLIVTGEFRGRVVYVNDDDGSTPFITHEPDFLTWYERWLDELLAGYKIFWFGMGVGGTEEELLAKLKNPTTSDLDRAEALRAYWRFPKISEESKALIPTFLSEPDLEIKASACRMIRTFELRTAEEPVGELLSAPTAELRREAIWTLMQFNPQRWSEKVSRLLYDDDQDVTETAFQTLKQAKALSRTRLLQLLNEPPNEGVLYMATYTIEWLSEDLELLLRLLEHRNDTIRFYATLGLRKIKALEAIPIVIPLLETDVDPLVRGSILHMLGELDSRQSRETLLNWTEKGDDDARLDAVDGLCKLGDERVIPVARQMLQETRSPVSYDANGRPCGGNINSIGYLVDQSLQESPNKALRKLSSKPGF